jgi:hypothetical protein
MDGYMREWRQIWTGRSPLVLRPGSTEEVSRILAIANETRTIIVPQGGNTGLCGGQIPTDAGNEVVLSLDRMTRILDVCFFSSAKDNRPASHPMGVDALEAAFRDAVKGGLVEVPPTEDAKKAGPAFSPCRYPPRTTRAKDSVEVVTAFVMDLDNVDDAFVDEVFANLASVGVRAFGWSTWGSGWKKLPQSWRVVVPFAVDVDAADWPAVWLLLSERLALKRNDVSTKNADRLHFVPNAPFMVPDGKGSERLNEPIRWRSLQGALFDPSSVVEESRLALSPKPRPSQMPAATPRMFLSAPASSTPIASGLV